MATKIKVLGQEIPSADTDTTLYEVPAANSTIASTLQVCNQANSDAKFRIAVRPANAAIATKHYLLYDTVIPANDGISLTLGLTLAATDVVTVRANTASVSFNIFGSEIY